VTAVGQAVLLPARLLPTEVAAVVLSPVTVATDPEDLATAAGTTNSLTEDNFAVGRHPRPKGGLDNGNRSWQLETIAGYLMKVCHFPPAVIKLPDE
jgi:phenylalanyl-tRNA synthetase beta subunit